MNISEWDVHRQQVRLSVIIADVPAAYFKRAASYTRSTNVKEKDRKTKPGISPYQIAIM